MWKIFGLPKMTFSDNLVEDCMNDPRTLSPDPATSSSRADDRKVELSEWNEHIARRLAQNEGIELTQEHLEVADFLRRYYLENGLPEQGRTLAKALEDEFDARGGTRYLRQLLPGGPVAQGSRIAGLPVPPYTEDASFGTTL